MTKSTKGFFRIMDFLLKVSSQKKRDLLRQYFLLKTPPEVVTVDFLFKSPLEASLLWLFFSIVHQMSLYRRFSSQNSFRSLKDAFSSQTFFISLSRLNFPLATSPEVTLFTFLLTRIKLTYDNATSHSNASHFSYTTHVIIKNCCT